MRISWRYWRALAIGALFLELAGCASAQGASVPSATPTARVAPTPRGTQTTTELLISAAQEAVGPAATNVTLTYDTATEQTNITLTISGDVPTTDARVAAAYDRVTTLCFQEQNNFWSNGLPVRQVTVTIMGPVQDAYDGIINQVYGIATVNQATARHISWSSATPASAWNVYDFTWLRPSFVEKDYAPPAPTTPSPTPSK